MSKGTHIILDCANVSRATCLDGHRLRGVMVDAAAAGGATVINTSCHKRDSPVGCSAVVTIDESHLAVHTWADELRMTVDVFTCGPLSARAVVGHLKVGFGLCDYTERVFTRF